MPRLRYCLNRLFLTVLLTLIAKSVWADGIVNVTQPDSHTETSVQSGEGSALISPMGQQLGQPKVKILEADTNNTVTRVVTRSDFRFSLTLIEQTGQVDINDLQIDLGPLTRTDGVVDSSAKIDWSSEGRKSNPLFLPSNGRRILTLLGELPEPAEYTVWLSLTYGDQLEVYTLSLTRNAPPGLVILEATDGKIVLQVGSQQFERVITVQMAEGQPAIDDLLVSLGPVTRQDGKPTRDASLGCSPCGQTQQLLKPGEQISIILTGKSLELTTYLSTLQLSYQNQTQVIPLTVTRAELSQNLNLIVPTNVASVRQFQFIVPQRWWQPWSWWAAVAEVDVAISETAGHNSLIYYPRLGSLQITSEEGKAFSVGGEQIKLFHRKTSGALTSISDLTLTATTTLAANEDREYVYRISRLEKPGIYKGQISVSGPDSAKVVKEFTIAVKDSGVWAILVVAIGVVGSFSLQNWTRFGRSRHLRSAEIAQEREKIERIYSQSENDPMWAYLLAELGKLQKLNRIRTRPQKIIASLDDIRARRREYQVALAVRDQVTEFLKSHAIKGKQNFQQKLAQTFEELQDELQETGSSLQDGGQKIQALKDLLRDVRIRAIEQPADALKAQLDDLIKESPELEAGAKKIVVIIDEEVLKNADIDKFEDLVGQLEQVRQEYAELRLEQLAILIRRLEYERRTAPNPSSNAWRKVDDYTTEAYNALDQARTSDNTDQALVEWKAGRNYYLRALIEHLSVLSSMEGRPSDVPEDKWETILSLAPRLSSRLRKARKNWEEHRYEASEVFYQEAQGEYTRILVTLLEHRMDALQQLTQERPRLISQNKWKALASDSLEHTLDQLEHVRNSLPRGSDSLEEQRDQYKQAHRKFVETQLELLEAMYERLQAYYENNEIEPPPASQAMNSAIIEAQSQFQSYLSEAERDAYEAQTHYVTLLNALQTKQHGTGIEKLSGRVAKDPTLLPSEPLAVETLNKVPQAIVKMLTMPNQALFRDKPSEYRSSEDWLQSVETRDLLAILAVLTLAVVSGWAALWFNNATFGGQDYITAFLWGFSINEATQGFMGIATGMRIWPEEPEHAG